MLKIIEHDASHVAIDRQNWFLAAWAEDFKLFNTDCHKHHNCTAGADRRL